METQTKPNLILLLGPPCSGKSTWSKEYLKNNPTSFRFNRDDLRFMLRNEPMLYGIGEVIVTHMVMSGILEALENGKDVIVDQTNCKFRHINGLISRFDFIADIKFKVFDVPIHVLFNRNVERAATLKMEPIPHEVIRNMYRSQQDLLFNPAFKEIRKFYGDIN